MDEREKDDPLRELGKRLDKARQARQPAQPSLQEGTGAALAVGWRVGLGLVVAVAVGVFVGWAVDKGLGTRPWGIVVGFFVGIAVGMYDVFRVMMSMDAANRRGSQAKSGSQMQGEWSDDED
jgi:ATP synthase protein I